MCLENLLHLFLFFLIYRNAVVFCSETLRFYRLKSKISNSRKTAIFAMSTLLNMIGPGFIYGLPLIYVELIHDLNVSRAEAALLMSTTRGVTFGAGITLNAYYIRSNCCQRLSLVYVELIHDLNVWRAEAALLLSTSRGVSFGACYTLLSNSINRLNILINPHMM